METNTATLTEIITLVIFLGSIVFLLGLIYQLIALLRFNDKVKWHKVVGIVILTRVLSISFSILLWKLAFQNIEIMFGPILLPGLISEIIFSPLILKIFRYRILSKNKN